MKIIGEGLALNDVAIIPAYSEIPPEDTDVSVTLAPSVRLNVPIISAGMDNVTASKMAIALARSGGLGLIHGLLSIEEQASEVDRVKRSEHGTIHDPFHLSPNHYVHEADALMAKFQISGVPITEHGKLVGIITNRDLRFETDHRKKIYEVMTKDNLITAPVGTTMEEAKVILTKYKVEKLPIVDDKENLQGLITIKDINKAIKYPNSAKDAQGRLLVGATVHVAGDIKKRIAALVTAKVDLIFMEAAHGHTLKMLDCVRACKEAYPDLPLMAGNAVTTEAARALIEAGADIIKTGNMDIETGVFVPPISAVLNCVEAARPSGVPIVLNGGIKTSGDMAKVLAAGASCCIVEGRAEYKAAVADDVSRLMEGLKTGMAYAGCKTIAELHEKARFLRVRV
jgi:IMP dehydrogenase